MFAIIMLKLKKKLVYELQFLTPSKLLEEMKRLIQFNFL
jgi:hypothetical protein